MYTYFMFSIKRKTGNQLKIYLFIYLFIYVNRTKVHENLCKKTQKEKKQKAYKKNKKHLLADENEYIDDSYVVISSQER